MSDGIQEKMKINTGFLRIATAFIIAGSLFVPSAQAVIDEEWKASGPLTSDPAWGLKTGEEMLELAPYPILLGVKADSYNREKGNVTAVATCADINSSLCDKDQHYSYATPLKMCTAEELNCVEEVSVKDESGKSLQVEFVRSFPEVLRYPYKGSADLNLPDGGTTFLVRIPGAPHAGGNLYLVKAVISGGKDPVDKLFSRPNLNAQITAVSLKSGSFSQPVHIFDTKSYGSAHTWTNSSNPECQVQCSSTESAVSHPLPLDLEFGLQIRLTSKIGGWLNGRVSKVKSSISTDSKNRQIIFVSGNAVRVPIVSGWIPKASAPESITSFYNSLTPQQRDGGVGYSQGWLRTPERTELGLRETALWLPVLGDKAVVAPTIWLISSIGRGLINGCQVKEDQLSGIVTTNATSYISGPPTFNQTTQTIDYQVIAPHLLADGSIFKGTYDLTLNSELARCMYRFTQAPISATVSIVSIDGSNQIATIATSEKDGLIHLGAYGFTFSSPTLKVKLSQEVATPTPSPTPTVTPKPVTTKKTTITCIKGKTIKKVTAVNPKCPSGYRKK